MKLVEDRIMAEGRVLGEDVLKVDRFLNHQIDPMLMKAIGDEFGRRFADLDITKVFDRGIIRHRTRFDDRTGLAGASGLCPEK